MHEEILSLPLWKNFPWWLDSLIILGILILLFIIKKLAFKLLNKLAQKTTHEWDDFILKAIDTPINLLLISTTIAILSVWFPLTKKK